MDNDAPLAILLLGNLSGTPSFVRTVEQGYFREDYALNKFSAFSSLCNGPTVNAAINGLEIHDAEYVFPDGLSVDASIAAGIYVEFHVDPSQHFEPLRIAQIICSASAAMEAVGKWELASIDILVPPGLMPQSMWPLQYQVSYLWDKLSIADHRFYDVSFELRSARVGGQHFRHNMQSLLTEISSDRVVHVKEDENPSEKYCDPQGAIDSIGFYKSHMALRCSLTFTLPNCLSADLGLLSEISYAACSLDCSDTCLLSFRVL